MNSTFLRVLVLALAILGFKFDTKLYGPVIGLTFAF